MGPQHEGGTFDLTLGAEISHAGGVKTVCGEQPTAREMFVVDEVIPVPTVSMSRSAEPTKKKKKRNSNQ